MPMFPCKEMHMPEAFEHHKRHGDGGRQGMLPQQLFCKILPHLELLYSDDDAGASTQSPRWGIQSHTEGHVVRPGDTYDSEDNTLETNTYISRKPI